MNSNPFSLILSTIILIFSFINGVGRRKILVGAHCTTLKDNVIVTEYVSISRQETSEVFDAHGVSLDEIAHIVPSFWNIIRQMWSAPIEGTELIDARLCHAIQL